MYPKVSRTAQTNPTGQTHVTHPIPMFLHVQSQLPRQPERRSTFHAKWCHVTDEGMRPDIGKFVMSLVVDFEILLSHHTPHHTPHHSTPNIVRLVRIGRQCTKLGRRTRLVHRNAVVEFSHALFCLLDGFVDLESLVFGARGALFRRVEGVLSCGIVDAAGS